MPTYIDPNIYGSIPNTPNLMGMSATLSEPVDAQILSAAVEYVRERFPYFYVRPQIEGPHIVLAPNELPVRVRETWEPTVLLARESNYHIQAWKCDGRRLAVEVLHPVTDGSGFMPYFKSVLFCYLSRRYGVDLDRAGFRLPGDEIPESEVGNPFSDEEVDAAERPLYTKPEICDFVQIKGAGSRKCWCAFSLKLPEGEVMRCCGEHDASPNALICVLLARAVARIQPQGDKPILGGVAVNHKAILGNHDSYRCFSNLAYVDYPPGSLEKDLGLLCTVTRGQIIVQTQPENVLFSLKQMKGGLGMIHSIPSIGAKMLLMSSQVGRKRTTYAVSYADSRSFGPLDPYIEELYVQAEPVATAFVCEVACINHAFFLHLEQAFDSEELLEAFRAELSEVGIPVEVMRKEPYRTSNVRYDDLRIPVVEDAKQAFDDFVGGLLGHRG